MTDTQPGQTTAAARLHRDGAPTADDWALANTWLARRFVPDTSDLPFSFVYAGQPSSALLPGWRFSQSEPVRAATLVRQTFVYADPVTHLELRAEVTVYLDYPAAEWVLYFANHGSTATPILESIQALDADLGLARAAAADAAAYTLHYSLGSAALANDFELQSHRLDPDRPLTLAPIGGRSSDGVLPYFNLERPDGSGVVMAVGWSGQWQASFARAAGPALRVQAGLELTHLKLLPGERIRSPRMLLLFWRGDRLHGHNLLRRLLLAHYTPTRDGRPFQPPIWGGSCGDIGFNNISEDNQLASLQALADHGVPGEVPIEYWQIDAGWFEHGWPLTGTWEPDPVRFPRGLAPIGAAVKQLGLGFILWFDPERVTPGTWLSTEHPEWLLPQGPVPDEFHWQRDWRLLDLGNPDALAWVQAKVLGYLHEYQVDIYRHDFNMLPLFSWRAADAPDRQGMSEIRYIEGFYAFWDYLVSQKPGLMIDNSASGGRRLDLEANLRSVPLFRTDYFWVAEADQDMTYALSQWLPIHAMGVHLAQDTYTFRSGMGTSVALAYPYTRGTPWDWLKLRLAEYQQIRQYFTGDYYPLLAGAVGGIRWVAYQFDRPDLNAGMVLAFRRDGAGSAAVTLSVEGLTPTAQYAFTFADTGETRVLTGAEAAAGLELALDSAPLSALITYQRQPD